MKLRSTTHGIAREEGTPSSDAFGVRAWGETVVAVLADGAGPGEPAREAAQRAVRSLLENYEARPRTWSPQRALSEFTQLLNRTLYQESLARFDRPEMISTLAAMVIEGDRLFGVNIGDSRVCLARNGTLEVLSEDHVETERSHVLTRALGMAPDVEPHVFERALQNGDITLLCSDGVSNHLSMDALAGELATGGTARGIVKAAHKHATAETMDDMSAIVLDVAQIGRLRAMSERALSIPGSLRKGEALDGYELVRSFQDSDRVWLAEKNGQRVVLKFAPLEAIDSEAHLNAFVRETWNATRVDSENFVSAHEPLGQTARYYVMEFVDAPSLSKVLQDRRLSVDSAIGLGRFLGESGLTLLRRDLVHGDIKPENILCVGDYAKLSFKLLDLGSAAEVFSVTSRAGTASYLAPERFHSAPISERTEIFSMGVTLYQSLTQAYPYGRIERFQTPVFQAAKRPTKLNPNIPPWLEAVILRAIARNPQRRYQHYSEFTYDLAHPEKVEPFFEDDAPLLERNPLGFYKAGFFTLLLLTLWLLMQLLTRH
ncbi:MAG: bifunctional protein-serine/threonine kinase/phosphatase [Roseimicrobium sp.]